MQYALCYVSNKRKEVSLQEIKDLLDFCQERNKRLEIKGVLLYSEGNFFQILEGEKEVVLNVFKQIKKDSRHYGLIQIMGQEISEGSYDGFKADILAEENKQGHQVPEKYLEALKGIPPNVKNPMKRMLENFIATR